MLEALTLQLRTTEVLNDILPVWWVLKTTQVWLQLSGENLERSRLSDTVSSNETKNLSWSWHRQAVELEGVGGISVCDLRLEVGWQVDDVDGAEWALLWADTTSNAQGLGDEGDLGCWVNLDTEASRSDDWAGLLALLTTFLEAISTCFIGLIQRTISPLACTIRNISC